MVAGDDMAVAGRRQRGRRARRRDRGGCAVWPGLQGGAYRPLSEADVVRIHRTALDVLERIGMAAPIPILREHALARGCRIDDTGRLLFPRALVEDTVAATPRSFVLYGRDPSHDIEVAERRVHFDAGGESIMTLDFDSGRYRPSTLLDLYDFARLADRLEHVHTFSKVVVATDVAEPLVKDVSEAYACIAGTTKHIGLGFDAAEHVPAVAEMCALVAGGEARFRARPFVSGGGCPVVSPLTFGAENSEICLASLRFNAPVSVVIAPQAGATAPAALAGALVQTVAETLAALMLVALVAPGHPVFFGPWPFVSDLRTGAFSGGGGEEAVLNAAAAQIAQFYGLPSSVGAGMTDSKVPDAQAGFEKGITVALAALAGANSVSETAGMMASLLGCSFEAMVIDDEMLAAVQRALRGIEVTDETLSFEVIRDAVRGPGHFLGHPQTLALMESEYVYPALADRSPPDAWAEAGASDMRERARERTRTLLAEARPAALDSATERRIRERFPIALTAAAMASAPARWASPKSTRRTG